MQSFHSLIKNKPLCEQLHKLGIKEPTPIQSLVIPELLSGQSLLASAKTGSGKTLAFVLPLVERVDPSLHETQVLVLCPTRELTLQVTSVFNHFCPEKNIGVLSIYGGQARTKQHNKLMVKPQIIVATAGRLLDFLKTGELSLKHLKALIIDEADQMLLFGFKSEMEVLLTYMPKKIQLGCFSATIDSKIKKLAYRFAADLQFFEAEEEANYLPNVFINVSDRWKKLALITTIKAQNPFLAIIFCRTIRRAEDLHEALVQEGLNCAITHGDLSQNQRQRILAAFKDLKYQFLITTDLNARGIDITGVSHIFNYDFPESVETFTHRIGRTARMGKEGIAYSLVTPKDEALAQSIKKVLTTPLEEIHFDRHQL